MRVWRIGRKPFTKDALIGRSGLFTSGRWHTKGKRVVYTSGSLALATLEVLVHVDRDQMPEDLVQIEIKIPERLKRSRIDLRKLPSDWRAFPSPEELQQLGNTWLEEKKTPVLEVPSAVIPEEYNYLLNPAHADSGKISILSINDYRYDERLFP